MSISHIPRTKSEAMKKLAAASLSQLLEWERIVEGESPADPKLQRRNSTWIERCLGEIKREIDRRYQNEPNLPGNTP